MATVFEIQDAVERHLEFLKLCISDVIDMFRIEVSKIPPRSREMNSLFVIFNQKGNFYWGILAIKGSLLSEAQMLVIFCKTKGSKFGGC